MIVDEKCMEVIVANARDSLSKYCFTECKAYCCRKGYLVLSADEVNLVIGSKIEEFKDNKLLTEIESGNYVLNIGSIDQSCPSLKDFKCVIHNNPHRPSTCKEFPLFIWHNNLIRVAQRCPAVKEGVLYPYLAQLHLMGCKISYSAERFGY